MHRSGTSALAGALARCGLGLPEHMLEPGEANERGFFESARLNELNNSILADFGQSWHSLEPIPDACWQGETIGRRRDEILALLAEEFSATRVPVIKDPRICRLLPLWNQALDNVSKDVRLAFIIRSPTEVALSLGERNQLEIEAGLLLWARYNLDAERHSRGLPRRFASFNALLADGRGTLEKLDLGIEPWAIDGAEIDDFLSGSLRHHRDGQALPTNVQLADKLFEILSRWASEGESQDDHSSLDSLRAKLDDMAPVLNELSEKGRLERKRRVNLAARSAVAEAQLASREQQFAGVADAIERSLREIEKMSEAFSRQAQQMGEEFARAMRLAEEKEQALRVLAEEKKQAVRALTAEREEAVRALTAEKEEAVRALTAEKEEAIRALTAEKEEIARALIADKDEAARALAAERGELEAALIRQQGLSEELSAIHAAAQESDIELRSVKKKYRSTQLILQRERNRGQNLEAQIAQTHERIRELESGFAVRLGGALRSFFGRAADLVSFGRGRQNRRQLERRLIRESGFFDAGWYLDAYPDVAAARADPAAHFAQLGWREGRNPGPAFCTTRYLRRYPDVAELGINPLVHFIEHGRFEGREVQGVGELPVRPGDERRSAGAVLPAAAPVYAGLVKRRLPVTWARSCNLADAEDAMILDGLGVATTALSEIRDAFEMLVSDFEALSGGAVEISPEPHAVGTLPAIQDGWFATSNRMMTRWKVSQATVIRAIQFDPLAERLALVGEGLATRDADPIAFDLASPTMPVMFIAAACDGEMIGARPMAFPSLLRGGFHYSEFVALCQGSSLDVMECSARLESQLRHLRTGNSVPMVKAIEVDMAGADGTGPLFRHEFRDLLGRVLMVDLVSSSASPASQREQYLTEAVKLTATRPCRRNGGKLIVASEMVPALAILVSSSPQSRRSNRQMSVGLIVSDADSSQPAIRFDPPDLKSFGEKLRSPHYPLPFPRLIGGDGKAQLGAIRQISRSLDDSEYLIPDAAITMPEHPSDPSIDWLVDPNQWDEALLAQSIATLGLQQRVGRQQLLFTRQPTPFLYDVARTSLGAEPAVFSRLDSALACLGGELAGHLGAGIVLHDPRTAAILASILVDPSVSSASCVVVASAKQGKFWRTGLVDGGRFPVDRRIVFGPRANSPAETIWRATYPVNEPTRLWLARPDDVRRWRSGDRSGKEIHLVTSIVSASLEGEAQAELNELAVAPAMDNRSIKAKVLVG